MGWRVGVFHFLSREVDEERRTRRSTLVNAHLERLSHCCQVEVWPPRPSSFDWHSLGETFRRNCAHVLVIISDVEIVDDSYYVFCEDTNSNYRIRGAELALDILNEFRRHDGDKYQVIMLVGTGTRNIGDLISQEFSALPLLVPPSILCWNAKPELDLETLLDFSVSFLENTLQDRNPELQQNKLDLRGTVHTFVGIRRREAKYSSVHFLPKNQIEEIEHIYYRLGLSAFELARRLKRILNHGMVLEFDDNEGKGKYLMMSTRYLFADLFGWLHVLRQQPAQLYFQPTIRTLEFAFSGQNKDVPHIGRVERGSAQLYKFDQRAMGESMVQRNGLEFRVLRYVDFKQQWERNKRYFDKLERALEELRDPNNYESDAKRLKGNFRTRLLWVYDSLRDCVSVFTPELMESQPGLEDMKLAPSSVSKITSSRVQSMSKKNFDSKTLQGLPTTSLFQTIVLALVPFVLGVLTSHVFFRWASLN